MTEYETITNEHQQLTKCINHWADSANFKGVTLNKNCSGLTGKCFKMPNDSYTNRCSQCKSMALKISSLRTFMKKEYSYQNDKFHKLSDLLQKEYKKSKLEQLNPTHLLYYSDLILAYEFKSEMPMRFRFNMRIELLKEENRTKLKIHVDTYKLYIWNVVIFLVTAFVSMLIDPLIIVGILVMLPIMTFGFHSRLSNEVDSVEKKLLRQVF
jgi:hypothetical protein